MFHRRFHRLIVALFFPCFAAPVIGAATTQTRAPVTFYVATNGNDAWSGRLAEANFSKTDGPFASLEHARDAVRELKRQGLTSSVEIVLRGGVYALDKTLVLTPEDSGTEACPITWRAQTGERVVIRGGRRVTGWKPWRDGIYRADLKEQGLKGIQFHQLFYTSAASPSAGFAERQILARAPNFDPQHPRTGGFVYTAGAAEGRKQREEVIYAEGSLPFDKWKDISQAEVVATYTRGWQFAITPILGVDQKTHRIAVRPVRGQFIKLNRFFIQNVLEALDAPGEWYLDRKESVLYFYPLDGAIEKGEAIVPVLDHLIEVRGTIPYPHGYLNVAWKKPREEFPQPIDQLMSPVEHLNFRGLDFEIAEQDALRMTGARRCDVIACRVTNAGNIGINFGGVTTAFEEEGNPRVTSATGHLLGAMGGGQFLLCNDPCQECRVAGCDVWSAGCEGIMLFGTANVAENNHVYDIGLYAKDAPCVNLLGEKNVARRNTLHDCPRCAIFIKGVDNVAELNDVHHTCLETCDMGGIRMVQRNAYLRGNIIRFNKVFDTVGYGFRWQEGAHYESPFFTWGIYLDDYTCGTTVHGNIIARAGRGGVMLHGGGGNTVTNNIIANAGMYQVEYVPMEPDLASYKNVYQGNRVERNVLVCAGEGAMPYRFMKIPKDKPSMANNLIWPGPREVVVGVGANSAVKGLQAWLAKGMDHGSTVGDPLFVNAKEDDYRLKPQSPAWELGFEKIPVEQIGCYEGPERASWPIRPNLDRFREKALLYAAPGYTPGSRPATAAHVIGPVHETFEEDTVGQPPRRGDVAAPKPSMLVVTDETAAEGKHCLKFIDAPGLPQTWLPRIFYPLDFQSGEVVFAADFRLDGKARPSLYIDPRQYSDVSGKEYFSGPMLQIQSNGDLLAGKKPVTTLPFDRWFRIELRMRLGQGAPTQSELNVTVSGEAPRKFLAPHIDTGFHRLERLVISSLANERTVFYMDNLSIAPASDARRNAGDMD